MNRARTAAGSGGRTHGSRSDLGGRGSGSAWGVGAAGETVPRRLSATRSSGAGAWQSREGADECRGRGDPAGSRHAGNRAVRGVQSGAFDGTVGRANEGIALSRSSVRRILGAAGIGSPRKRRAPQHRSRRERYPQAGMLVQIDASPHDWLEGRGPRLTLFAAIDDATGEVLALLFRAEEDAHGYFLLVRQIVARYGRPLALYHDRHSIFRVNAPRDGGGAVGGCSASRRSSGDYSMNWRSRRLRRAPRKRKGGWSDCSARCKTAW